MDHRFRHPMYTKDDSEMALNALAEYTENNNKPEQMALQGSFVYEKPQFPSSITKQMLSTQYGCNLITMANYLNTQDIFFSEYMPHWTSYFSKLGIEAYCSFMRPSSFTTRYIINQVVAGKMEALTYWNPDIFWVDYKYGDDKAKNLANPLNNFYRASLHIPKCDNFEFIEALDKYHGIDVERDKFHKHNVNIIILPSPTPFNMVEITKLIHMYL